MAVCGCIIKSNVSWEIFPCQLTHSFCSLHIDWLPIFSFDPSFFLPFFFIFSYFLLSWAGLRSVLIPPSAYTMQPLAHVAVFARNLHLLSTSRYVLDTASSCSGLFIRLPKSHEIMFVCLKDAKQCCNPSEEF